MCSLPRVLDCSELICSSRMGKPCFRTSKHCRRFGIQKPGKVLVRFHAIHQASLCMRAFARRIRLVFHRAFLLHVAGSLAILHVSSHGDAGYSAPSEGTITRVSWRSVDLNGCHDWKTFRVVVCLLVRVLLQHGMANVQARCLAALCSLCPCYNDEPMSDLGDETSQALKL
jgi:hypothetical protein